MKKSELKKLIQTIVTEVRAVRENSPGSHPGASDSTQPSIHDDGGDTGPDLEKDLDKADFLGMNDPLQEDAKIGVSTMKKSPDKKDNTQMGYEDKSITSTDKPTEKKEGKKLPIVQKKSNTEKSHHVTNKSTPAVPSGEKKEGKALPVGGHGAKGLKEEIIQMVQESLTEFFDKKDDTGPKSYKISFDTKFDGGKIKGKVSTHVIDDFVADSKEELPQEINDWLKRSLLKAPNGANCKWEVLPNTIQVLDVQPPTGKSKNLRENNKIEEMAKTPVSKGTDGIVKGGVPVGNRKPDAASPTGFSITGYGPNGKKLANGTIIHDGDPVEAPKNTGANYKKVGANPNMGRPAVGKTDTGDFDTSITATKRTEEAVEEFIKYNPDATPQEVAAVVGEKHTEETPHNLSPDAIKKAIDKAKADTSSADTEPTEKDITSIAPKSSGKSAYDRLRDRLLKAKMKKI